MMRMHGRKVFGGSGRNMAGLEEGLEVLKWRDVACVGGR